MSMVFPVMGPYARRHKEDVLIGLAVPTIDGLAYLNVNNPDGIPGHLLVERACRRYSQ